MSHPEQLIFLIGGAGAGKDVLGGWLESTYGLYHCSLSTKLREHAVAQQLVGASPFRASMRALGQQLRSEQPDILVRECLDDWRQQQTRPGEVALRGLVITGHGSPEEVDAVRYAGGLIVNLKAPAKVRYARTVDRDAGTGKATTPENFLVQDRIDRLGLGGSYAAYDDMGVMWARDRIIDVSQSLEQVQAALGSIVEEAMQSDTATRLAETPPQSRQDREIEGYLRERYAERQVAMELSQPHLVDPY